MKFSSQITLALCLATLAFGSCNRTKVPSSKDIEITWEVISNTHKDFAATKSAFTMRNNSNITLDDSNWELFFNHPPRTIINDESQMDTKVLIKQISGDWYRISPKADFVLEPDKEITIYYETNYFLVKESDAPVGLYFVFNCCGDDIIVEVENYCVLPFSRAEQYTRHNNDHEPEPTPKTNYSANKHLYILHKENLQRVIPTPKSLRVNDMLNKISDSLNISYHPTLAFEASYLKEVIENLLGWQVEKTVNNNETPNTVFLTSGKKKGREGEGYSLTIGEDGKIYIDGDGKAGTYYGIQSFISLLPIESILNKCKEVVIPEISITDSPRFGYRGMHIDVSRNFMSKETILKAIDILAYYKINRLHLHLTDDEGWRIEIAALPELTAIGGHRGHTTKEAAALHPSYGSGPIPFAEGNSGSGHYTRNDYIEILRYAHQRHIQIIPEINMPGHCQAAIKAMEARYNRFMKQGNEEAANEFRLIDPDDQSVYLSAQHFTNNIANVARESVYRFFETVVDEMVDIYNDANAPLTVMHVGGDEVPKGAWTKSPMIDELMQQLPHISRYANMHSYFTQRALGILENKGLKMAGWEEVALHTNNGRKVNPQFANGSVIPYVWNSLWGAQDLAYRLANSGYPLVMCHVTNFYFDLAYNNHPKEPGLYWGGFVNTYSAWHYNPYNIFKTTLKDNMGRVIDIESEYKNMVRLKPEARRNILGLQAQLWTETVHTPSMLEYYMLPKLIGFAESAWASERQWETTRNTELLKEQVTQGWNVFANTLAQRELPRMAKLFGGYNYRIPPPGAKVENGKLYANVEFPGLIIRYTTDGSEPSNNSPRYNEPVKIASQHITLRSFDASGKGSRAVRLKVGN